MAHLRNIYAVDITKHDPSFVFSALKIIAHNATIYIFFTLLHVRSDISYIKGLDGSDIDDYETCFLALLFLFL